MFFGVAARPVRAAFLLILVLARTTDCFAWQLSNDAALEILGGDVLSENVLEVRRQATKLNPDQRFEFLTRWVLPGETHPGYRMTGLFAESQLASSSVQIDRAEPVGSEIPRAAIRFSAGPELVSPVIDLLDAAAQTGRLDELCDRILALPQMEAVSVSAKDATAATQWKRLQNRSRIALLLLVAFARDDGPDVAELFDEFFESASQTISEKTHERWPETLVTWYGAKKRPEFRGTGELLDLLWSKRAAKSTSTAAIVWQLQIASLRWQRRFRLDQPETESIGAAASVDSWQNRWMTTSRMRAHTKGRGFPSAEWRRFGHEVRHVSGHDEDYLLYHIPLTGDFSVEAELLGPGEAQLLVAGTLFGPRGTKEFVTGNFNTGATIKRLNPALAKMYEWVHCRSVIENGNCRTYLNGRLLNQRHVGKTPDPWVGVRSWCLQAGAARDVRITGKPDIPESVVISATACRSGWVAFHETSEADENSRWRFTDGPDQESIITGLPGSGPAGSLRESLLQYFRPLIEDGSVEYEFYYEPGRVLAHPALDRQAFLLEPDGIRIHSISNEAYGRSASASGQLDRSARLMPARSPAIPLPLKSRQWNRLRLAIIGKQLTIALNGSDVFAGHVESSCSRHIGLFHFTDQTELRVRDVTMRGDWPRTLPPVSEQVLADGAVIRLEERLSELEPVFVHEFRNGLPEEKFTSTRSTAQNSLQITGEGIVHTQRSTGKYIESDIDPAFQLVRDFDVTADFEKQSITEKNKGGCGLHIVCDGGYSVDVRRRWQNPNLHRVYVQWKSPAPEGTAASAADKPVKVYDYLATEAESGRLRITRRNDTLSVLFAESDSSEFRVIASQTFPELGNRMATIRMSLLATDSGTSTVTWKQLRVASEELLVVPAPTTKQPNRLFVMNADGTGLKQITQDIPSAAGLGHGSPDWSSTGEFLAFDAWSGRGDTTHTFLVRPDGSDLRDLGVGVMPSFTHDGRRLALTWGYKGLATINLYGKERQVISPVGWSVKCSPDGKWIVYESPQRVDGRQVWNLVVIDLKTKAKRVLLTGEQNSRYARVSFNMSWSPDSRHVVFRGDRLTGGAETAMVSVDGSSKGFHVLTTQQTGNNFGWHPDGDRILMIRRSSVHSGNRLFEYDLQTKELSLFKGPPLEYTINHAIWSPDGRQIAFSGWMPPHLVRWKPSAD